LNSLTNLRELHKISAITKNQCLDSQFFFWILRVIGRSIISFSYISSNMPKLLLTSEKFPLSNAPKCYFVWDFHRWISSRYQNVTTSYSHYNHKVECSNDFWFRFCHHM